MNMGPNIKYVKLSTGDELLTILEKPEGGFFHFKHPIKISHILDEDGKMVCDLPSGFHLQKTTPYQYPPSTSSPWLLFQRR